MNVLSYPLRYLMLRNEGGWPLFTRNWLALLIVATVLTLPFTLTPANYFGADGFLDKFGSFSAVLTGFYIAALVGIASFAPSIGDIDKVIQHGRVEMVVGSKEPEPLTRRQYVCALFGYLSFLSLTVSVLSILLVVIAAVPFSLGPAAFWVGLIAIVLVNITLAHMIVTTFHGLYYLIDRLYDKEASTLPKSKKR